jgi:5-(carboxyamino)imidazole ribonucleotide mutase
MPKAAVIMGSRSDYDSMKDAIDTLESFGVTVEKKIVSAHRTPEFMAEFARQPIKTGLRLSLQALVDLHISLE